MNQDIGSLGGSNDRKRRFNILRKKKKKKKEEEEKEEEKNLKKLEQKVKKNQIISLFTLMPFLLTTTIVTLFAPPKSKKQNQSNVKDNKTKEELSNDIKKEQEKDIKIEKNNAYIAEIEKEKNYEKKLEQELENIKSKRILEIYEDKLEELRWRLRKNYYERSLINEANSILENPDNVNIDKINDLLYRLDNYKEKINVNPTLLEQTNYIDAISEEEIQKIKEKINIGSNKQDLFVLLEEKVEEINEIDNILNEKNEIDKNKYALNNEKLSNLSEKDHDLNKFNNEILAFQNEQDFIVKSTIEKVRNNSDKIPIERIQLTGMSIGSSIATNKVRKEMKKTGVRSATRIHTIAVTYLYYFTTLLFLRPTKQKYKITNEEKYSKDIEKSIAETNNILNELKQSSKKIILRIEEFKQKFAKYKETIEYQKVLDNLLKLQQALKEKEYELQKIKEEQEKEYQKNQENVKIYRR